MSKRDRSVLGGLVLAMIVGVGGSLALAASCLGRDVAHRADDPLSTFPEDRSARTSSGGVRGEEAIGETQITSVELPAGAPVTASAPDNAPPPNPNPNPTPAPPVEARPIPVPIAHQSVIVNVDRERDTTTSSADAGAAAPPPVMTTTSAEAGSTAPPVTTGDAGTTSSTPPPPRFLSEPPLYGASSWVANHEAGAGPFTTERNVPDRPGP